MGKKSKPPKAPDLQPVVDAQLEVAKLTNQTAQDYLGLSKEQFAWMKENAQEELDLARQQADRLFEFQDKAFASDEEAKAYARQVGDKQMEAMNLQMDYARRDRDRYENKFLPMQDAYIAEAQGYDTPQRREQEAAQASVDIQRQSEAARANADARLRSMGIDPSQMRSASLLQTQDVAMAAQQAGAANAARKGVEDRGRIMRADALNVGAGLPAQSLSGFAGAGAAGAGAVNAGQASQAAQLGAIQGGAGVGSTALGFRSSALNNVAALTGSPTQWAGLGMSGLGQASNAYSAAGNTASQSYQNQMSSWKAAQEQSQQGFNNIASVATLATGMMMAEGGSVSEKRRMMASGGPVERISVEDKMDYPLASQLFNSPEKGALQVSEVRRPSWADSRREMMRDQSGFIMQGEGHGKEGRLDMTDRMSNAVAAKSLYKPTNVWEGQTSSDPRVALPATFQTPDYSRYMAEGGAPRGALPVRQVRDKIPAELSEGEYVVPADVVRSKGIEFFDKLVHKYHRSGS